MKKVPPTIRRVSVSTDRVEREIMVIQVMSPTINGMMLKMMPHEREICNR